MMSAFNQDAIEKLTFITKLSDNLKVSVTDKTDDNFDLVMPEFILCIRDFTLDLEIDGKECNEDEYIEHCLKERKTENSKSDEAYNRPRQCIKKYFTKRKAFTFDRPAARKAMKNLEQVKEEDLTSDFVQETKRFIAFIYERPAKMLHNKTFVTGRMLQELLNAFVTGIKNGAVPCIDDALAVMSKKENEKHAKDAIDSFCAELGKLNFPVGNKTQLMAKKFSFLTSILTDLNSKLLFDDDHAVEMAVKAEMEKRFKEFEAKNDKKVYENCLARITDIYNYEIKHKINRRIYLVSGGFEKYKKDMQCIVEKFEMEQDNNNTDRVQVNKAKRDFLAERQAESEEIMTADKSISEKEQKDELEKRQKKLEADFKEEREKALKRSREEFENQRKQHELQLVAVQKAQEEKEARLRAAFFEEKLARRDTEIDNLAKQIEILKDQLKSQEEEPDEDQLYQDVSDAYIPYDEQYDEDLWGMDNPYLDQQSYEIQSDEIQSDEEQSDEDQSGEDQSYEEQLDEEQSGEDQSYEDQSDEEQSGEDQSDEEQSGEDQSDEEQSYEEQVYVVREEPKREKKSGCALS